jgi:hypothetical protein
MDRPEFDSTNDTVHLEVVRNHEESKPRDPLYQQTTRRTRFLRPDISVQAIATDKGRYSLHVSGPTDQETGEQGTTEIGWYQLECLPAQRPTYPPRLKIGKPPRNIREDVY